MAPPTLCASGARRGQYMALAHANSNVTDSNRTEVATRLTSTAQQSRGQVGFIAISTVTHCS